jgi:hypothetical protein
MEYFTITQNKVNLFYNLCAAVVLSTGFNSDVSHPIRKKHIINYGQNQQNISSHPGFKKPQDSRFCS